MGLKRLWGESSWMQTHLVVVNHLKYELSSVQAKRPVTHNANAIY